MKRLVWLVLALVCVAFGQVQSADVPCAKAAPCPCCCCHPGGCGMPGCCPSAPSPSLVLSTAPAAEQARQPKLRLVRLAPVWARGFPLGLAAPARAAGLRRAPALERASAAKVPLFTAHCSFRI